MTSVNSQEVQVLTSGSQPEVGRSEIFLGSSLSANATDYITYPSWYRFDETPYINLLFTARNEVGARLCFYTCVWFCSQGGRVLSQHALQVVFQHDLQQVSRGVLSQHALQVVSQHDLQQVSRGLLSQHALQVVSQHALQQVSRGVPAPRGVCFQGVCSWGVPGGDPSGTTTAAGSTHPTGMHSCFTFFYWVCFVTGPVTWYEMYARYMFKMDYSPCDHKHIPCSELHIFVKKRHPSFTHSGRTCVVINFNCISRDKSQLELSVLIQLPSCCVEHRSH